MGPYESLIGPYLSLWIPMGPYGSLSVLMRPYVF